MAFKPTDWTDKGIGIIRIQNLTVPSKPLNRTKRTFDERYRVRKGDLLASWSATLDAFIWDREDAVLNQHIFKVTPSECVDSRFLFFQLRELIAEMAASEHLHGSTMKHINRGPFLAHSTALPPLAEQRRIVAKLDALTTRLARGRKELDQVPFLAARLRQAAISAVAAAAGAATVRFEQVLDYKGGSQPPKSTFHAAPAAGRIRLLQIRDFASDHKAVYIDDNGKWPRCEADDIMIGRYGASVGKILTGKAGAYNVALVKMMFDRAVTDPRFLFHWLKGETFQGRLREISRSAQDGFNKEDLADLPFPQLPLISQIEAAKKADALIARADRLEAEAARARVLLDRLEAAILAKAFRGELVPQDPNDEPATILLDRIRAQRAAAPKAKRGRRTKSSEPTNA
ncbi:MAG: restriction endonuclease subunit S [Erythrobacter sp.]|nr:restriction endonuclease subunit S [Erythrobacter sp.]